MPYYCRHHLLQPENFRWEQEIKGYLKVKAGAASDQVRAQQHGCLTNEPASNQ